MIDAAIWPRHDYSRIPYRLYHDPELYAREQEAIFRGPAWSYLVLDAEIPDPGDFRAAWIGDTPVIVNRDRDGEIKAFVNRCAHRGALVRRETAGNAAEHVCIYHQWCYGLDGRPDGDPVPPRGARQGRARPVLRHEPTRIAAIAARTHQRRDLRHLAEEAEPLEDYLGAPILTEIRRILHKPIRVLGYTRQRIRANWKLYAENTRDNYHASLNTVHFGW